MEIRKCYKLVLGFFLSDSCQIFYATDNSVIVGSDLDISKAQEGPLPSTGNVR